MSAEERTAAAFGPGLGSSLGLASFRTRAAGARERMSFSLSVELEAVATARPDPA